MNTINAIQLAPAPVPPAGETIPAATVPETVSGMFLGLLGELLAAAQPDAASPIEIPAPESEAAEDGEADAALSLVVMAAAIPVASMATALPALESTESVVPAVPNSVAPAGLPASAETPLDATAIETATQPEVAPVGPPVKTAARPSGVAMPGEDSSPEIAAAPAAPAGPAVQAAPSLESAIRAAAANIGQATERAFAGRRLDGPAVTGPREGSALQAIDGDAVEVEVAGFARVAVNASADAASQQAAGEGSGGNVADGEVMTTSEPVSKPLDGFKALLGSESRPEFSAIGGSSQPKPGGEIAGNAFRAAMPESVSVRDVGDLVVRSVHYFSGKTDEVVTVRLVPRSLGELQIAVRHAGDGIEVVMTAANAAARDALEGHVAGLREALSREGVEAPRVTIQVAAHFDAAHQPPLGQQGNPDTANHAPRHAPSAYREPQGQGSGALNQERQEPRRRSHDGRLNMWA